MKTATCIAIAALSTVLLASTSQAQPSDDMPPPEGRPDPAKIFAKIDTDSSGTISLDEFKVAHEKRKERMKERFGDREPPEEFTPPTAEEIFAKMDANSDGSVTQAEFIAHEKERRAHRRQGPANE